MRELKGWAKRLTCVGKLFLASAAAILAIAFILVEGPSTHPDAAFSPIAHWFGLAVAGFCVCAAVAPMLRTWAQQLRREH